MNDATGVVTWGSNKSTYIRGSGAISVTITGLGGITKTVSATCTQNAGYYTYSNISFTTLTYGQLTSAGGSSSPSISYSQTYG